VSKVGTWDIYNRSAAGTVKYIGGNMSINEIEKN
jgi:hypothetical protein